jgi:small subunit ribosomal protein S6
MSNQYETVFILNPVLSDKQIKEAVKKYKSLLNKHKVEIVHEHEWGLRKLAYPVKKKSTGHYYLIEFSTEDGAVIADLELAYKRDEGILRYMTVKLDKHAIAYNVKKRNKAAESAKDNGSKDEKKREKKTEKAEA